MYFPLEHYFYLSITNQSSLENSIKYYEYWLKDVSVHPRIFFSWIIIIVRNEVIIV